MLLSFLKCKKESHVGIIEKTPRLLQLGYMVDATFNPVVIMFELHVGCNCMVNVVHAAEMVDYFWRLH